MVIGDLGVARTVTPLARPRRMFSRSDDDDIDPLAIVSQ